MATPLSADRIVSALRAEGVTFSEHRNWRSHNRNHRGAWGPVHGVMIHHTVSRADNPSVELCYNGHSTLPGPLCHAVGRNDGVIALVSAGRANHAGAGDPRVLDAVIAERSTPSPRSNTRDGNAHFYGLEIVNMGDNKDTYTRAQYDAAVRWATALCRAHGWGAESVIGHREWQSGKIDPRGPLEGGGSFAMDAFRAAVRDRLRGREEPTTPNPEDSVPNHTYFERKDPVTLTPGTWYTVTWDRVWEPGKGWAGRDRVQTLLRGENLFSLDIGARFEGTTRDADGNHISGLTRGQEVQVRVGRNSRKAGADWARAKSWPINSPTHDAGSLHIAHHWQGHLPASDDNRLVVDVLIPGGGRPVRLDGLVASLFAWPL